VEAEWELRGAAAHLQGVPNLPALLPSTAALSQPVITALRTAQQLRHPTGSHTIRLHPG